MEEYASAAAKKSLAWSKEGMIDHIMHFIIECNLVSVLFVASHREIMLFSS